MFKHQDKISKEDNESSLVKYLSSIKPFNLDSIFNELGFHLKGYLKVDLSRPFPCEVLYKLVDQISDFMDLMKIYLKKDKKNHLSESIEYRIRNLVDSK